MKNQVEKQVQAEIEIQQAREKQEKENKKVVKDIGVSIHVPKYVQIGEILDNIRNTIKK